MNFPDAQAVAPNFSRPSPDCWSFLGNVTSGVTEERFSTHTFVDLAKPIPNSGDMPRTVADASGDSELAAAPLDDGVAIAGVADAALRATSFPPQEARSTTQPAINATLPRFLSRDMSSSVFFRLGP